MFFVWKCFCGAHESLRQCFNLRFFFFFQRPRSSAVNHILVAVHNTRSSFFLDISRWCNWPPEKKTQSSIPAFMVHFCYHHAGLTEAYDFHIHFSWHFFTKKPNVFLEKMGGVNHTPPPTFQNL